MKKRLLILILPVLTILILPTSAILTPNTGTGTNITFYNSSSYIHDVKYTPIELVYLFIGIGFLTILVSRVLSSGRGMFAIISPLSFAIAAWYANYMTLENINGFEVGTDGFMLHTEMIVASPVLSVLMVVCFIISLLNILDIFFLSQRIEKTEPKHSEE